MKKLRQEKIIELIDRNEVETQEQLAELLRSAGYEVTQATVSRDIRALQLTKVTSRNGSQRYSLPKEVGSRVKEKFIRVLQNSFISMDNAGNILVIKTFSGMAMAAAAAIDELYLKGVVGSIAGDDTIMVAVKTEEQVHSIMEEIRSLLE